ncbi:MAG: glycosyltransferase [Anaerolineaceae bacterium]|nr:glycosyltransferase [Anaerolineaceae bacterium]
MISTVEFVIPVFNEVDSIETFHNQLLETLEPLPHSFRFTYVDDGSKDDTLIRLTHLVNQDERVRVIELSRNFGHQSALSAGLDQADADVVITLDGDGEHPPGLIPEMLSLADKGYDIVIAQRTQSQKASLFKRVTSDAFYWMINQIGNTQILPGAADFRLMTRPALNALKQFREYHRFLRGMVAWMGYRSVILPYVPSKRLGGSSKYSLKKMIKLALNAVFSFSLMPLYLSISLGGLFLLGAIIEAVYVLSFWATGQQSTLAPGWSSLMFILLITGGMILITLGFIGIYIGYIFQEVKGRPIYLVRQIIQKNKE